MPIPLKILMAEDNPDDCELVIRELRRAGFDPEYRRVETEAEFAKLLDVKLDLVLSDYHMPQFTGFRALELLRQSGLEIPFILISGTIGEDVAVEAMRNGASDYLMKDRLTRLGSAVIHAIAERKLREEKAVSSETHRYTNTQQGLMRYLSPAVLYVSKLEGANAVPRLVTEDVVTLHGFTIS